MVTPGSHLISQLSQLIRIRGRVKSSRIVVLYLVSYLTFFSQEVTNFENIRSTPEKGNCAYTVTL